MHALGPTIRELTHFTQLDATGSREQKSDRAGIRLGMESMGRRAGQQQNQREKSE